MLLMLTARNLKVSGCFGFNWHNVHTSLREKLSNGSSVKSGNIQEQPDTHPQGAW
jgi:hypothetical protein